MRLLLLSDIHANNTALQAVLLDAQKRNYDEVFHLGDAVGYGPHPREVVETLHDIGATCVLGNHDHMMLEYVDQKREYRESVVTTALRWQMGHLGEREINWMRTWRDGFEDHESGGRFRHGTPTSLDDYMDCNAAARDAFAQWQGRLGFVGHTHMPMVFATLTNAPTDQWIKSQPLSDGGSYMVPPSARVILNPGSVGQPRDGNPRASYAVFDTTRQHFEVFRVAYNIGKTQDAILEAGLPQVLAARLAIGK